MYNFGFENFVADLLGKARSGYFLSNPKELPEYQGSFKRGAKKFHYSPAEKAYVRDELRKCGIQMNSSGRWVVKKR